MDIIHYLSLGFKGFKGAFASRQDVLHRDLRPLAGGLDRDNLVVEGKHRHIINGHVPVRTIKGETPIKAGGKHLVIDGGFSLAYQPKTGIAGYTLTFHSRGLELVQHYPFTTAGEAIRKGIDIRSKTQIVELSQNRMYVKDTDKGKQLKTKVEDLKKLLIAYRMGLIKQISR